MLPKHSTQPPLMVLRSSILLVKTSHSCWDESSTLSSFNYWCGLAGISQYQIIFQNKNYYNYGNVVDSLRIIIYKIENWEIHLGLPRDSWTLDSDIKGDLIEKVSHALVRKLGEFESSKIIDMQQIRDSSSLA